MGRHSKQLGGHSMFTNNEKAKADHGSITQRLGSDSQLPFGYCCLSLNPIEEGVISPSGHIYSREAILEYILQRMKDIKDQTKLMDEQQKAKENNEISRREEREQAALLRITNSIDGIPSTATNLKINGDKFSIDNNNAKRSKINDNDKSLKLAELQQVCPWIPQFTPSAPASAIKEPPKRPLSPFSQQPIRSKELIPIDLIREPTDNNNGTVKYVCSVSKKTISNQKVVMIKTTGCYMIESIAKELAYPTMTCPNSGKKFKMTDIIELIPAASSFASSGDVEVKKYRPAI